MTVEEPVLSVRFPWCGVYAVLIHTESFTLWFINTLKLKIKNISVSISLRSEKLSSPF